MIPAGVLMTVPVPVPLLTTARPRPCRSAGACHVREGGVLGEAEGPHAIAVGRRVGEAGVREGGDTRWRGGNLGERPRHRRPALNQEPGLARGVVHPRQAELATDGVGLPRHCPQQQDNRLDEPPARCAGLHRSVPPLLGALFRNLGALSMGRALRPSCHLRGHRNYSETCGSCPCCGEVWNRDRRDASGRLTGRVGRDEPGNSAARLVLGRPSTRSPRMLRRISEVPARMPLPRASSA